MASTVHLSSAFTELTGQFWIGRDPFRVIKLAGGCEDSAAFYHLCKKKTLTGSVFGELHYIVTGVDACVLRVDNLDEPLTICIRLEKNGRSRQYNILTKSGNRSIIIT